MEGDLVPWIFASVMAVGIVYLVISLIFGEIGDLFGGLEFEFDSGADSPIGFGCMALSGFLAGFGAVGLGSYLAGSNVLISTVAGTAFGYLIGRLITGMINFLRRQESTTVKPLTELIGQEGRITINTASGKLSEAMFDVGEILRYPVKEQNDAKLTRGDMVVVTDISGSYLYVKKKETSGS